MSETLQDIMKEDAQQAEETQAAAVQEEAATADESGEIADLIGAAAAFFYPMYPKLEQVYTPATCQKLGKATAAIFTKYGLTLGGVFDRWGVEIAFAVAAVPVGMATYRVVTEADEAPPEKQPEAARGDVGNGLYAPLEAVN